MSDPRFTGGDGSSPENAVIVHAPDKRSGIQAEYAWLEDRFGTQGGDWTHRSQDLGFHEELGPMDTHMIYVKGSDLYPARIVFVHFAIGGWFYDGL